MQVLPARVVFSDSDRAEITDRINQALTSGRLTLGANTQEFEAAFAAGHNSSYAVAVSSGTAALEIILRGLRLGGTDVVVPTNTFAATAFAVQGAGARPVLADVDADTLALSLDTLKAAVTANTSAVILVHIAGLITPAVVGIRQFCAEHGLALIEDAAHAHGSTFGGQFAGSFGVAAAFSFYPTKVITSGEGGMIVTADEQLYREALALRDQGKAGFLNNLHTHAGYAWRLSELHAAVGLVQLRHLPDFLAVRRGVAARYDKHLDSLSRFRQPQPAAATASNYYKYPIFPTMDSSRAEIKDALKEKFDVQLAGEVYELPLHRQPIFSDLDVAEYPVADEVCARQLCLPLHSDMRDGEVETVLAALSWADEVLV